VLLKAVEALPQLCSSLLPRYLAQVVMVVSMEAVESEYKEEVVLACLLLALMARVRVKRTRPSRRREWKNIALKYSRLRAVRRPCLSNQLLLPNKVLLS
jgi:hypothetical protein